MRPILVLMCLCLPFAAGSAGSDANQIYDAANARYHAAIDGKRAEQIDPSAVIAAADGAERARALGSVHAPNLLYLIFSRGAGIPGDPARALAYLREGVARGDDGAKSNYALMLYRGGPGVPRDRDLAVKYLVELNRGKLVVPEVRYYLGVATFRGEGGLRKNAPEAMRLIRLAADQGDADAQRDMGKNFEFGWNGTEDLHRALEWYQLAAERGDGEAQWRIGMAYVNGEERDADAAQAVEWFRKAADSGSTQGMTSLAVMYATGDGVKQDWDRARELYEEAAEGGEAHALLNLSGMYLRGEGVETDPVHGFVLLSQAATGGDAQAQELLPLVQKELTDEQLAEARRRLRN